MTGDNTLPIDFSLPGRKVNRQGDPNPETPTPNKGYLGSPYSIDVESSLIEIYQPVINFLRGVDVLIHEAQYTPAVYVQKVGWGHSSVPNACLLAKLCEVKKLIVIHHDPMHDDDFLQNKLNLTRQILENLDCPIEVSHGFDRKKLVL